MNENGNELLASQAVNKLCDSCVDMTERTRDIESRRLLLQLEHAGIPDSVCEENSVSIANAITQEPWGMCNVVGPEVVYFIQSGKWATEGYRLLIEGGDEHQRKRVMYYCLYRGILARFASFAFLAKIYDWPTILPIIGDYKNPNRLSTVEGMRAAKILAIKEIDVSVPMTSGGADTLLTSVLRGRADEHRPTIITLTRPSVKRDNDRPRVGEIFTLVNTKHDIVKNLVVRIMVSGEAKNEE